MFQAWAEVTDAWRVRVESLVEGTRGFLAEVIITGRVAQAAVRPRAAASSC